MDGWKSRKVHNLLDFVFILIGVLVIAYFLCAGTNVYDNGNTVDRVREYVQDGRKQIDDARNEVESADSKLDRAGEELDRGIGAVERSKESADRSKAELEECKRLINECKSDNSKIGGILDSVRATGKDAATSAKSR